MKDKMRKCAVCGTEYSYCPKCGKDNNKPTYFFTFCSENCHDIYSLASKYENGQITDIQAKELLDKCNLTLFEKFRQSYKDSIAKIISATSVVSSVANVEVELEDVKETSEEIEVSTHEQQPIKKSKNKRFRFDDVE